MQQLPTGSMGLIYLAAILALNVIPHSVPPARERA